MAGAAAALVAPRAACAAVPQRIAAIDWAALENLLALGVAPVAATELWQFRLIAVEPPLPASVTDIGLRGDPNYELLRMVAPDLILSSPFYAARHGLLERIAPVLSLDIYAPGRPPLEPAETAMRQLAAATGREADAEACLTAMHSEFDRIRAHFSGLGRPLFPISIGDARHVRVFGADSLFGDAIVRLGLKNAWTHATSYSAAAPVGLERLADTPDAVLVVVGPTPPDAERVLADSALWAALPAVRSGRVIRIPPTSHYGGLPAARRFARFLAAGLREIGAPHG